MGRSSRRSCPSSNFFQRQRTGKYPEGWYISREQHKGVSAGTQHLSTSAPTQHLGTCSVPRHPVGTFSTCSVFHYEHLRHLQHLQLLFHYVNCFSQHLAVQFKEQNLGINFYREVLRKAVNIVEK
jgi:hypothetical protein